MASTLQINAMFKSIVIHITTDNIYFFLISYIIQFFFETCFLLSVTKLKNHQHWILPRKYNRQRCIVIVDF
jgi:hypothetical protein